MRRPLRQCSVMGFLGVVTMRREAIEARRPPCFHAHSEMSSLASARCLVRSVQCGCCYLCFGLMVASVNPRMPGPGHSSQSPGLGGLTRINRLVTDRFLRCWCSRSSSHHGRHCSWFPCLFRGKAIRVPKRFIHLAGHPQSMQQDRQFARHGDHRLLLGSGLATAR